ncbi:MAG: hypothetical protein QF415_16395 [Candidatus Undinarchaeales archaeon]|nr:hypothetical protein [Candidatus Undinarchaeales archaeon]MDP7494654.1 hypothetical protein [Candidatus Undinarchaeales archaeon]
MRVKSLKRNRILNRNEELVDDHSFCTRIIEEDTRIIGTPRIIDIQIDNKEYEALVEHWEWDDIYGNTLIFHSKDVASIPDEKLNDVTATFFNIRLGDPSIEGDDVASTTIVRQETFTLVNLFRGKIGIPLE